MSEPHKRENAVKRCIFVFSKPVAEPSIRAPRLGSFPGTEKTGLSEKRGFADNARPKRMLALICSCRGFSVRLGVEPFSPKVPSRATFSQKPRAAKHGVGPVAPRAFGFAPRGGVRLHEGRDGSGKVCFPCVPLLLRNGERGKRDLLRKLLQAGQASACGE